MITDQEPQFLWLLELMGAGGMTVVPAKTFCMANEGKKQYAQSTFGPEPKCAGIFVKENFSGVGKRQGQTCLM
jgi:hypothetical protein